MRGLTLVIPLGPAVIYGLIAIVRWHVAKERGEIKPPPADGQM